MTGLKWKAIVFGVAVDMLGSLVIGFVAYAATAARQPLTESVSMQERFGTIGLVLLCVGRA